MKREAAARAEEQALAWFVALRDESATDADRDRFAAWLAAQPQHRHAWLGVQQIWQGLDRLPRMERAPAPLMPTAAPLPITSDTGKPWRWLALAAMLAGLAVTGLWTAGMTGVAWQVLADNATGSQERQDITLPDGSAVTLGPMSALSLAFDGSQRRVILHRGEAFFAVTHDAARPFVVEAGHGAVTVLGTRFDVKMIGADVAVSVAEGVVSVAAGSGAPLRLTRGQAARYGAAGVTAAQEIDVADVASWREGRLIFQGVPLGDVLADLERYRSGRIFVTDPDLAALPVTGAFDVRRGDGALDTIAHALPIRLTRLGDLIVFVQPAAEAANFFPAE